MSTFCDALCIFVISGRKGFKLRVTACTVVQAVAKVNSQSNGKGQILTPWGSETPERISMKLGIYN